MIFFNEHIIALDDLILDDPKNNRKLSALKKGHIYTAQAFHQGCCEELVNVNIASYDSFFYACPKCGTEREYKKGDLFFMPLAMFRSAEDGYLMKLLDQLEKKANAIK